MNAQLKAINIMRKRLDDVLQSYWSEMFTLKYESSWSAKMQAKAIFEYGHQLIAFCMHVNILPPATANSLHTAWDAAYDNHREMRHCHEARVVHPFIPNLSTQGVMLSFVHEAESRCNHLLHSARILDATKNFEYVSILKELDTTIECAFDLQLITESQKQSAYKILHEYYQHDYTHRIFNFTR